MNEEGRIAKGQTAYATEPKTGRVLIRSGLRRRVIALDNALTEQSLRLSGDFLYADQLSTGTATIKLNNTSEDPMPFTAQSMLEDWPIEDVFISCAAQPGLVLNLWYGWRARIRPPQSVVSLTGNVQLALTAAGAPQGSDLLIAQGHGFAFNVQSGAVAAQPSFVAIDNANGSGKRVYVDGIVWWTAAASLIVLQFGATGQGADAGTTRNRLSGGAASTFHLRTGTAFVGNGSLDADDNPTPAQGKVLMFPYPYIIEPNNSLAVIAGTVNTALNVGFFAREY